MPSGLFYIGTRTEVEHGDRIEYTTLFRRHRRPGTVVCIPEKTALELNDDKKMPDDWLIRFDDGTFTGWMYHPEEMQPHKRLAFVSRAIGDVEAISNAELDAMDEKEAEKSRVSGDLLGCAIMIAIGAAIVFGIWWLIAR